MNLQALCKNDVSPLTVRAILFSSKPGASFALLELQGVRMVGMQVLDLTLPGKIVNPCAFHVDRTQSSCGSEMDAYYLLCCC